MSSRIKLAVLLAIALSVGVAQLAIAEEDVVHAVSGAVTKIDSAAKTVAIKTADGTEHVFKVSEKATSSGIKEGSHVVVHYTEKGGEKTAVAFKDLGKGTVKVSDGTVTHVDSAARTITVKTEKGGEDTFHVAKDASVDTEHGVVKGSEYTAKEGEKVTVHYTETAGKKIAHFIGHV